jgi:hypothetical protein
VRLLTCICLHDLCRFALCIGCVFVQVCVVCPQGSSVVGTVFVILLVLVLMALMFWIVLRSGREAFLQQLHDLQGGGTDMELSMASESGSTASRSSRPSKEGAEDGERRLHRHRQRDRQQRVWRI